MKSVLVDTSAVIGMLERADQRPRLLDLIAGATLDSDVVTSEITLGELAHSLHAATDDEARNARQSTFELADRMLALTIDLSPTVIDAYGLASAVKPRACSQNDRWIVALAKAYDHSLFTEDEHLHDLARQLNVESTLARSNSRRPGL